MSKELSQHRSDRKERLGSFWHFPDLTSPDLSSEIVPGQHKALALLTDYSIAEIFSEDPAVQALVFKTLDDPELKNIY